MPLLQPTLHFLFPPPPVFRPSYCYCKVHSCSISDVIYVLSFSYFSVSFSFYHSQSLITCPNHDSFRIFMTFSKLSDLLYLLLISSLSYFFVILTICFASKKSFLRTILIRLVRRLCCHCPLLLLLFVLSYHCLFCRVSRVASVLLKCASWSCVAQFYGVVIKGIFLFLPCLLQFQQSQ